VKHTPVLLSLLILVTASALPAQSPSTPVAPQPAAQTSSTHAAKPTATQTAQSAAAAKKTGKNAKKAEVHLKPFSSLAFGGGMSLMGVNMQAATNMNRYLNLRVSGNYFSYTANNININGGSNASGSTTGVSVSGKANFATVGASLDYYPFPRHGWRLSPGLLFYNQNNISAIGTLAPGNSITLDKQSYYTDSTNPMTLNANLGLNTNKAAFTFTTGWGNVIPRKRQDLVSSHLSFPFEFGVAVTGTPKLNATLTGDACTYVSIDGTPTLECDSLTNTTPGSPGYQAQHSFQNQLGTWRSDLNKSPLYSLYPIFSFGVSYSFDLKPQQ